MIYLALTSHSAIRGLMKKSIYAKAIRKLKKKDLMFAGDYDLCYHGRGFSVDVIRSDVDQRWSVLIDLNRQVERFNERKDAIEFLRIKFRVSENSCTI